MANLAEIRAQYPQYNSLTDQQLSDKLYDKLYAGKISRDDFYRRVGFVRPGPTQPEMINTGTVFAEESARSKLLDPRNREPFQVPDDSLAANISGVGHRAADAALLGGADELVAALKSLDPANEDMGLAFQSELEKLRQSSVNFGANSPNLATAADVSGIVGSPFNLLGGEFITAGRNAASQTARAGLTGSSFGATGGFLGTDGSLEDRSKGAVYGGGLGAGVGAALPVLGRMGAPNVRPEVRTLLDRGVTPTPGQMLGGIPNQIEEKISTVIPGLGDMITVARRSANDEFNRAVYNEVLQPIGAQIAPDIQPGRGAVSAVHQAVSDHYDQILAQVNLVPDPQMNADIQQVWTAAQRLAPDQREMFDQIVQDQIVDALQRNGGALNGDALKGVMSEISADIRGYSSSASHNERRLGERLGELQDVLRQALYRSNPMHADQLRQTDAAFARLVRLEGAAGAVGNDVGVFTPQQYQKAVKDADSSSRKNRFAQGQALSQELSDAGRSVLANKFPNSGTPGRMVAAGGLTGLLGYADPLLLAGTATAMLPYTGLGRRAVAGLMTARPQWLRGLATGLPDLAIPFGIAGGQAGAIPAPRSGQ